jgi:D-arabinose 1-dehydrogenase-like Zn-dependent alcohol dehydrogenase
MKALVKAKAEPGLWLQDVPEPAVGINDVLIKVLKTGICGSCSFGCCNACLSVHISCWYCWCSAKYTQTPP